MDVQIIVSDHFLAEKKYLLDVIFGEWLGISFSIETTSGIRDRYLICLNEKTLVIEDHFFSRCTEKEGYLQYSLIPQRVSFSKVRFSDEADTPVLFGTGDIEAGDHTVICKLDIFAAVFYMLTRWEELVTADRDYLERFPAESSLAFRCDFLHRPVVDEWIGLLKAMLHFLNPALRINYKNFFRLNFTHDIDLLNAPVTLKEFAKDILKRRSASALVKRSHYFFQRQNPYDIFDYFMDISERHQTRSRFYFMTGHNVPGRDGEPYNSTPLYKKSIHRILERGHTIGFHPSLLSYNNPEMFAREKAQLEADISAKVTEGRQHALRFSLPDTWQMWEDHGMTVDSTLGYSAKEGFRCGTGCTFPVFNVASRKQLKLKEMPLIMMDTTLNVNRRLSIGDSEKAIREIIATGTKFNIPITLLFHNLIDDAIDWKGWKGLYDKLFGHTGTL